MTGIARGRRGSAAALGCVLALLAAGCTPPSDRAAVARPALPPGSTAGPEAASDGPFEPSDADFEAVDRVLAARAAAAEAGDVGAFLATVDPRQPKLVAQQRTLAANLARLDVSRMTYVVERDALVPAGPVPGDAPRFRALMTEHVELRGTLSGAVVNPVQMTFVRRGDKWYLGAENQRKREDSYESPQERPWFGGPIAVTRSGRLTVLVDRSQSASLPGLLQSVSDDIAYTADVLEVEPERVLLVDATSNGLSVDFSALSKEEAAAVSFPLFGLGDDGEPARVGSAIKINPELVEQALEQDGLMRHELTHFLLRDLNESQPKWVSEGIASYVEYYPSDFSRLVVSDDYYDRIMAADRRLPILGLFNADPAVNYPVSQAAVAWLAQRGGMARLKELMRAYRQGYEDVNVDALTPRILRRVYGVREGEVVRGAFGLLAQLNH
jgi:hypothetical protein